MGGWARAGYAGLAMVGLVVLYATGGARLAVVSGAIMVGLALATVVVRRQPPPRVGSPNEPVVPESPPLLPGRRGVTARRVLYELSAPESEYAPRDLRALSWAMFTLSGLFGLGLVVSLAGSSVTWWGVVLGAVGCAFWFGYGRALRRKARQNEGQGPESR